VTGVRVLDLDEIRQLIDPAQAITAVREALMAHGRAQVTNPHPGILNSPTWRVRYTSKAPTSTTLHILL
jgi:ornithine cyclodeaminase/alanine dehydrogenase-like protein (mu-crystallin family)